MNNLKFRAWHKEYKEYYDVTKIDWHDGFVCIDNENDYECCDFDDVVIKSYVKINNDYVEVEKILKKEIPIKPIGINEEENIFSDTCKNCKEPIVYINGHIEPKRCIECGQKIDWRND